MVEAEVWAVDAEQGHGLLDKVGRIRADGEHVLVEGHWAEFVSRRVVPDLETGEEISIADDPERWVASLIQLIRSASVGYLHVIERVTVPVHVEDEITIELELEVDVHEDMVDETAPLRQAADPADLLCDGGSLVLPAYMRRNEGHDLREQAARLAAEARAALPVAAEERPLETGESRTSRAQIT